VAEHEPSIGQFDDWYTPPEIFDALGLTLILIRAHRDQSIGCRPAGSSPAAITVLLILGPAWGS
jgi:hypothetical protein